MKQLKKFNIYLRDPEEIVTCPECGSRTEWEDLGEQDGSTYVSQGPDGEARYFDPQLHTCLNCYLVFVSEIDWEGYDRDIAEAEADELDD